MITMDREMMPPEEFLQIFQEEICTYEKTWEYFDREFGAKCPPSLAEAPTGWRFMDCGSWDEFVEMSAYTYYAIARECRDQGITHVYDIGCNAAWQGRIFKLFGIAYTGIEVSPHDGKLAPEAEGIEFVNKAYPFPVVPKDRRHAAAISSLCVGFSLPEGNLENIPDFAGQMYRQIAADFDYFVGKVGPDAFGDLEKRFGVLSDGHGPAAVCWGNRERFHAFDKAATERVMQDMSLFGSFSIKPPEGLAPETPKSTKQVVRLKPVRSVVENGDVLAR